MKIISLKLLNKSRQSIFLVAFIAMFFLVKAQQDIKEFTLANIHEVKSIEPDSNNFNDLAEVGKAIGNARIVMLGEQDHGDAASFLAKTRLIKYLHEKLGFEVLVFESDFWGLNQIWDNIPSTGFSIDSIRRNNYSMWSACQQVQPLYSYISACYQTKMPLIVSGMDCRHSLPYSRANYLKQFDSAVLQKSPSKLKAAVAQHFKTMLAELIDKEYDSKASKADQQFFIAMIDTLKASAHCNSFWLQELNNLKGCALNARDLNVSKWNTCNYRDKQMADNLYWIYHDKYPNKKIIVWAASTHIARNINASIPKAYYYNNTMGNEIYKLLKDTMYALGCASYTGEAGRLPLKKFAIPAPNGECFENWVHSKAMNYGFIDFKKYTGTGEFKMAGVDHSEMKARWADIFDGVFYIQQMYPCDKVE